MLLLLYFILTKTCSTLVPLQSFAINPKELKQMMLSLTTLKKINLPFLENDPKLDEIVYNDADLVVKSNWSAECVETLISDLETRKKQCYKIINFSSGFNITDDPLNKNNINTIIETIRNIEINLQHLMDKIINLKLMFDYEYSIDGLQSNTFFCGSLDYILFDIKVCLKSLYDHVRILEFRLEILDLFNDFKHLNIIKISEPTSWKVSIITDRLKSIFAENYFYLNQLIHNQHQTKVDCNIVIPIIFKLLLNYNIINNMKVIVDYSFYLENPEIINEKMLEIIINLRKYVSSNSFSSETFNACISKIFLDFKNNVLKNFNNCQKKILILENETEKINFILLNYKIYQRYVYNSREDSSVITYKRRNIINRLNVIEWLNFKMLFEIYFQRKIVLRVLVRTFILLIDLIFNINYNEDELIKLFPVLEVQKLKNDFDELWFNSFEIHRNLNFEYWCTNASKCNQLLNQAKNYLEVHRSLSLNN